MSIRVEVVSAWYNEETLAPFFFEHYKYADAIHIILDNDTDDSTRDIIRMNDRAIVYPIDYPDGIDWVKKSSRVNEIAMSLQCDWVIAVDADEFVWPVSDMFNMKGWLEKQTCNIIKVDFHMMYQHYNESPLNPETPSMFQRRYGDSRNGVSYEQTHYSKPCVAKPETEVEWDCGIHAVNHGKNLIFGEENLFGAHWAMADVEMAIKRRIAQKKRQSNANYARGHGIQNWTITTDQIRAECMLHIHDKQLF